MIFKIKVKSLKLKVGFTLIEILVVIALIGILAGVLLVSLQGVRASARDAQRKADLETIQSALEMYKSSCGHYPSSIPTNGSALSAIATECKGTAMTFLSSIPRDPITLYHYAQTSPQTYTLSATMESGQIMQVTPQETTFFTPTATPTPTAAPIPTATPTPCGVKANGTKCGGNDECYSCWCVGSTLKCAVHP